MLEQACFELFAHEYWQVLNDKNLAVFKNYLKARGYNNA